MKTHQLCNYLLAISLLFMALLAPQGASADILSAGLPGDQSAADISDPVSQADIAQRLGELDRERMALALQLEKTGPDNHLESVAERLEQIERQLKTQGGLAETLAQSPENAGDAPVQGEPSVYRLNALYDQLTIVAAKLQEKRAILEAAKEQLEDTEKRAREAKAKLQAASEKNRAINTRKVQLAELAVRSFREQVNLALLEVRLAQQEAKHSTILEGRITELRAALANREGEPEGALTSVMEREAALQREKNRAERQLATVELRLASVRQRYAQSSQGSADILTTAEALTAFRDVSARQIALIDAELERLQPVAEIWQYWDSLLRVAYTPEELLIWEAEAKSQVSELKQATVMRQSQLADLQIRLESLEVRKSQLPAESEARPVLGDVVKAFNSLYTDLIASERQIAADSRVAQRFLDDALELTGGGEGFLHYASRGLAVILEIWRYEITTIDDSPFTIGSLTLGLLLFLLGLWFSRLGSRAIGRVAESRLKLDAGSAHAMQAFSFYALLAGFTLLALQSVHFPLTAFAFLGGALAIGIGFGSQNVMNNFISGLILMLERPVRAEDVVEVDGSHGVILRIGPRSTHIRSTDGRHIVVPNSFFLESNVVNWTLSDELIRAKVSVGVAYGSPTRLVKQLIEEVVRDEPSALDSPEPIVIFDAFADNSLNFDVHFWVHARSPMSVQIVASKIRFAIDDAFREHELVIAFPQRDVHLDSMSPIEVRMVGATDSKDNTAPNPDFSDERS